MKKPTEARSCGTKPKHADRQGAMYERYLLMKKGATRLTVYKCRYCKHWHVGHRIKYKGN